jgi:hypothetical protein
MVRIRFAYVATLLGPIVAAACFSSSDGPIAPQLGEPDATTPEPDGSVEPEAAVESGSPEASTPDAVADAPVVTQVEAQSPSVTLQVVGLHGPTSGVPVYFSDANGALLASLTTNASGLAVYVAPAGGQVTVVLGTSDNPILTTLVGVQPGDYLTAIDPTTETFAASFVSTPPSPPGTNYVAFAGSSSEASGSPGTVPTSVDPFFPYGVGLDGKFPVLVLANNNDGTPAGFLSSTRNAIATDGGATAVTSPAGWQTTIGTESLTVTNPDPQAYLSTSFNEVSDEISYVDSEGTLAPSDGGPGTTWNFPTHPGYADFVQCEVDQTRQNGSFVSTSLLATRRAAPTPSGAMAFDLSTLLPAITGATLDSTDPTRPVLSWTTGGPLTTTIGSFASIAWFETLDGGAVRRGTWVFVTPPGATTLTPPVLPSATPGPGSGANWELYSTSIVSVDDGAIPDYATLRATPGALTLQLARGSAPFLPPLALDRTMGATILQIQPAG